MDRCERQIGRQIDGWIDRQVDGWMNGCKDGRIDK